MRAALLMKSAPDIAFCVCECEYITEQRVPFSLLNGAFMREQSRGYYHKIAVCVYW
jgi:hypothetical protein